MQRKRGRRPADRHARGFKMHSKIDNLRDLPSVPYRKRTIPLEFREYISVRLLPQLAFTGRKIAEQQHVATHCLHNAVNAGRMGYCVGDTRSTNKPGVRLRVRMWDAIFAAGLVNMQVGSEASGMQTRYLATPRLLAHFEEFPLGHLINLQLARNTTTPGKVISDALVICKDNKKLLPLPENERATGYGSVSIRAYLECVEDDIEFINHNNLRHTWEAFREQSDGSFLAIKPNICLKQVHSKNWMRYARLYTWGIDSAQSLPKRERKMMLIDGKPVAELDYSGMHIRMLHHLAGNDPAHEADMYQPERVLPIACRDARTQAPARRFVKLATNILLNCNTRKRVVSAVAGLLYRDPNRHIWADFLRREGITPREVVARIVNAHPEVKHYFFTEIGSKLQTLDGIVMRHVLMAFAKTGHPALGIHDSTLCQACDVEFAEAMMKIHYHALFGFWPVVARVY